MSDFGSMVTVHRSGGGSTTADDDALVRRVAKELVFAEQALPNDYADFNLRFGQSRAQDGSEGIMVGLTEYWLGDDAGNEGLDSEVLLARDGPVAERFADEMRGKLGPGFEVEAYCDHW